MHVWVKVAISDTGTATGGMNIINLPFTPRESVAGTGHNGSTGAFMGGCLASSNGIMYTYHNSAGWQAETYYLQATYLV